MPLNQQSTSWGHLGYEIKVSPDFLAMKNKKALTLMEILISLVILSLTMSGLLSVLISAKRHSGRNIYKTTAAELGRFFLDPLTLQVRQDQWGANCLGASMGCPGFQDVGTKRYTPAYTITNLAGTNLRKVRLNISWND